MRLSARGLLLLSGLLGAPLVAAVFLFGCCVLPFHGHRMSPLCHAASAILGGHGGDHETVRHPVTLPKVGAAPALTVPSRSVSLTPSPMNARFSIRSAVAHRATRCWLSHGAARCDDDVGLELLLATFRI